MNTLTINEAPPCEVAFFEEGSKSYAKLTKDDFEQILRERRIAISMAKRWMVLAAVTGLMLAGATYWFATHPFTQVTLIPMSSGK